MVSWLHGHMVSWSVGLWSVGLSASWLHGHMVTWSCNQHGHMVGNFFRFQDDFEKREKKEKEKTKPKNRPFFLLFPSRRRVLEGCGGVLFTFSSSCLPPFSPPLLFQLEED